MEPAAKKPAPAFEPSPRTDDLSALQAAADGLICTTVHYAETHGLVYAAKEQGDDPSLSVQCPVAMLPFKVDGAAFREAVAMSPLWNKLVDAVSRDLPWLYATLEPVLQADPFTADLVKVCRTVHGEGLRQRTYLGIHRSDYMLHEPEGSTAAPCFLQVELNTIASSMGAHASNAAGLHRFMLGRYAGDKGAAGAELRGLFGQDAAGPALKARLPENVSLRAIPAAMAKAHEVYGAKDAVVVMVATDDERNFADQRFLEYALWESHGVRMVRRTLTQLHKEGKLDAASGRLTLAADGTEVSVVYFRSGYGPDCYPSQAEWDARAMLERSLAIKCPSVAYQLVGAKKVQQALAKPGAVERFLGEEDGRRLRKVFAGLWGLGLGEDDAGVLRECFAAPEGYVLKPQREGGGYNFYGEGVAEQLRMMTVEERSAYILMQRIFPKAQPSVLTRGGKATATPGLSEFGFYSTFVGDGSQVHLTEHAGHLVRTKGEGVDEGGVAAGYAVISSPFLVD